MVRHAVAAWKRRHPELRTEITEAGLLAILQRDHIRLHLHEGKTPLLGRAIEFPRGEYLIMLHDGLSGLARVSVVLHELGHLALHMDDTIREAIHAENPPNWCEENGKRYLLSPTGPLYRRHEAEADLFADLLLAGQHEAARAARSAFDPEATVPRLKEAETCQAMGKA